MIFPLILSSSWCLITFLSFSNYLNIWPEFTVGPLFLIFLISQLTAVWFLSLPFTLTLVRSITEKFHLVRSNDRSLAFIILTYSLYFIIDYFVKLFSTFGFHNHLTVFLSSVSLCIGVDIISFPISSAHPLNSDILQISIIDPQPFLCFAFLVV